jgi:hypothetical protein
MYLRHALALALIVACAAPALAAKGFWIVRGADKEVMRLPGWVIL